MQLNDRQWLILTGVLQDLQRLAAMPCGDDYGMSRVALGRHRLRAQRARAGLVPMALENWMGHAPSNSEHVLCHREYARLEDMGLLVRCNPLGGRRTTHLKLTAAGRRVAERLLAEECEQKTEDIDATIDWSTVDFVPIETPPETDETDGDVP